MAVQFSVDHKRTSEYRFYPEDIKIKPELNGRHELPDIEWLITDMLRPDDKGNIKGQHTPVVIRNDGGMPVLVAGFSRWRAISEINTRGLTPLKMQLRCTYVQCSETEAFIINISENRFRNPTTPVDDAHNIKRLMSYGYVEEQIIGIYFPTYKTEGELKEARKFMKDRTALISLSPEAEKAVKSGRVTLPAAKAIAKLSEEQQNAAVAKEGTIERRDVVAPKAPKVPKAKDPELFRRITAMFEDVGGMLNDPAFDQEYIEVDRILLLNLYNYVEELRNAA